MPSPTRSPCTGRCTTLQQNCTVRNPTVPSEIQGLEAADENVNEVSRVLCPLESTSHTPETTSFSQSLARLASSAAASAAVGRTASSPEDITHLFVIFCSNRSSQLVLNSDLTSRLMQLMRWFRLSVRIHHELSRHVNSCIVPQLHVHLFFFCGRGCEDSRFVHGVRGVHGMRCERRGVRDPPHPLCLTSHPQKEEKTQRLDAWWTHVLQCKLCSPREGRRHSARPALHGTKKKHCRK